MATDTQFVRGAEKLARRIQTIRKNLAIQPLVDDIGALLLRRTLDRFDRQVDPDGKPWEPLKESTLRRDARNASGMRRILNRTGELRASIDLIRGSVAGSIFTNTGAGVRIGIKDPIEARIGSFHQQGKGHNPQRRFLGIGELDIKAVDAFMRRRARQAMEE